MNRTNELPVAVVGWSNQATTFLTLVEHYRQNNMFCDCTIACERQFFRAHKIVLAMCSEFFEAIFSETYDKNPVIIMNNIDAWQMECLMDYMYKGETSVPDNHFDSLCRVAKCLQIKGFDKVEIYRNAVKLSRQKDSRLLEQQIREFNKSTNLNFTLEKVVENLVVENLNRSNFSEGVNERLGPSGPDVNFEEEGKENNNRNMLPKPVPPMVSLLNNLRSFEAQRFENYKRSSSKMMVGEKDVESRGSILRRNSVTLPTHSCYDTKKELRSPSSGYDKYQDNGHSMPKRIERVTPLQIINSTHNPSQLPLQNKKAQSAPPLPSQQLPFPGPLNKSPRYSSLKSPMILKDVSRPCPDGNPITPVTSLRSLPISDTISSRISDISNESLRKSPITIPVASRIVPISDTISSRISDISMESLRKCPSTNPVASRIVPISDTISSRISDISTESLRKSPATIPVDPRILPPNSDTISSRISGISTESLRKSPAMSVSSRILPISDRISSDISAESVNKCSKFTKLDPQFRGSDMNVDSVPCQEIVPYRSHSSSEDVTMVGENDKEGKDEHHQLKKHPARKSPPGLLRMNYENAFDMLNRSRKNLFPHIESRVQVCTSSDLPSPSESRFTKSAFFNPLFIQTFNRSSPVLKSEDRLASFGENFINGDYGRSSFYRPNLQDCDSPLNLSGRDQGEYYKRERSEPSTDSTDTSLDMSFTSLSSPASPRIHPNDPMLEKIQTNKRKRTRGPKSWEFLLRLLKDPVSNPTLIKWEDETNFVFRLVRPEIIAQRWGKRTGKHANDILSYESFARGLRYHYATGALNAVSEKSFVYQFGVKAQKILKSVGEIEYMPQSAGDSL